MQVIEETPAAEEVRETMTPDQAAEVLEKQLQCIKYSIGLKEGFQAENKSNPEHHPRQARAAISHWCNRCDVNKNDCQGHDIFTKIASNDLEGLN